MKKIIIISIVLISLGWSGVVYNNINDTKIKEKLTDKIQVDKSGIIEEESSESDEIPVEKTETAETISEEEVETKDLKKIIDNKETVKTISEEENFEEVSDSKSKVLEQERTTIDLESRVSADVKIEYFKETTSVNSEYAKTHDFYSEKCLEKAIPEIKSFPGEKYSTSSAHFTAYDMPEGNNLSLNLKAYAGRGEINSFKETIKDSFIFNLDYDIEKHSCVVNKCEYHINIIPEEVKTLARSIGEEDPNVKEFRLNYNDNDPGVYVTYNKDSICEQNKMKPKAPVNSVNVLRLNYTHGQNQMHAVYPVAGLTVFVDIKTGKVISSNWEYKPT